MQPVNGQRFYYPELDGLRFIAFLLVFIHNANPILRGTFLETFSAYSWFGVDLFFCLSAFLLTKLLVMEYKKTGKINIKNFYIRRILRIWPLYFFYIIVGTIIIAPMQGRNINIPGHLLSLATFTFNFGYFALLPSPILIFIHLWSISFEEQFYAIIPWFLRYILYLKEKSIWIYLGLAYLMGNIIRVLFIIEQFKHPAVYFLPITHFDSIFGGILLGLGLLDKLLNKVWSGILFVTDIITLWIIMFLPNNDVSGWNLMCTYPLIGIGVLLLTHSTTSVSQNLFQRLLGNSILVHLGKISYGLYIFHASSFMLSVALLARLLNHQAPTYPKHTWLILVLGFSLTLIFSTLSYNLLEKPFLKLKERFGVITSHTI